MNWHERLKTYKKSKGVKNKDIADYTGLSLSRVKSALAPSSKTFPLWMKVIIKNWEQNEKQS